MQKIINNLIKYLLLTLFFFLPLVNSHFFDFFGVNFGFYVDGNYEFTKVIFFNILSGIIILLFFIQKLLEKKLNKNFVQIIFIPKIIYFLIGIILVSTIFSNYFYTSLLGNSSKSHSTIMFINLILLFVLLINSKQKLLKKILITTLISSFLVTIIGIKEYFFPSFNYGDLTNRALGTFGHPNYLALYTLIILPFLFSHSIKIIKNHKFNKLLKFILVTLLMFCLLISKSFWGTFLFIIFLLYQLIIKTSKKNIKKIIIPAIFVSIFLLTIFFYKFSLITKLHSFLSRFFIWETTLKIIFSDIKNILVGSGLGTLEYIFDNFKSPYLYIFENIGFTADRPHNLILNFFYNFGILGLYFIIYLIYKIIKKFRTTEKKYLVYYESMFLFLLFTIFNFPSISHYLIILLIGSYIYQNHLNNQKINLYKKFNIGIVLLISIFGIYFSTIYYINEYKIHTNSSYFSNNYLYNKIKLENYEKNLFGNSFTNIQNMCFGLIQHSSSVENYFYCGNLLWTIDQPLALNYYNTGLTKLPDLRNPNSKYNKQFLIKNFVDKKRFFSSKYSNLEEILERTGKK